jgi:hypothetical protein
VRRAGGNWAGAVALLWRGPGYLITKPAVPGHVAIVFEPGGIDVSALGQAVLPAELEFGRIRLGLVILGVFAATFGAAMETSRSAGYTVAPYFGPP